MDGGYPCGLYPACARPRPVAALVGPESGIYHIVGYCLIGVAYIAVRDLDVAWSLPASSALPSVLVALTLPVLLVATVGTVGNTVFGMSVSELPQSLYAASVAWREFLSIVVPAALLRAFGIGVVFFGVVQPSLREVVSRTRAVVLTLFVALLFKLLPFVFAGVPGPSRLALFVVAVAVSVAVGFTAGLVSRHAARGRSPGAVVAAVRDGPYLPVAVVGVVATPLALSGLAEFPDVVVDPVWLLVVAAGAVVAERSRSVWPAVATVFVYDVSFSLAGYVEALLGITSL